MTAARMAGSAGRQARKVRCGSARSSRRRCRLRSAASWRCAWRPTPALVGVGLGGGVRGLRRRRGDAAPGGGRGGVREAGGAEREGAGRGVVEAGGGRGRRGGGPCAGGNGLPLSGRCRYCGASAAGCARAWPAPTPSSPSERLPSTTATTTSGTHPTERIRWRPARGERREERNMRESSSGHVHSA